MSPWFILAFILLLLESEATIYRFVKSERTLKSLWRIFFSEPLSSWVVWLLIAASYA